MMGNLLRFAITVVLAVQLPLLAVAQGPFGAPMRESDESVLLAPRSLLRLLREGETAISEQRYAEAIEALGILFADEGEGIPEDIRGQDFFLEPESTSDRQPGILGFYVKTLKGEALRMLGALPEAGRELLEIQFGVTARQLLDQAVANRDLEGIAEVARRYPFTFAGYDAQILMARRWLTEGSPLAAAAIFQTLLDYPAARTRFGTELLKASVFSWMSADMDEAAVQALQLAVTHYVGQSMEIGGQQIPVSAETDWASIVKSARAFGESQPTDYLAEDWLEAGGAPNRNARTEISMPLSSPRWIAKIHGSVPEKNALLDLADMELQGERVILPKFEVRALGDLLLTKTTDSEILAIDFKTGLTRWPYYRNSAPADLLTRSFSRGGRGATSGISDQLKNRVWGSSAYGRFSCDEQRLYYVTEGDLPASRRSQFQGLGFSTKKNQLQAASIREEGMVLWIVGAPDEENPVSLTHDDLSEAYFLGPPLSYEGRLYAIVEVNGETRLVVLDPETGGVLWWQQLCHPFSRPLQIDSIRKSQAISPTIADGVIVCPTGAQTVVAVDLLTHNLRWLVTYGPRGSPSMAQFRGAGAFYQGGEFDPLAPRWNDNTVIAQDGLLVMTPVEQDMFFVRNLLTGQPVSSARPRENGRYVAGVQAGRIYFAGDDSLYCYDIEQQAVVWNQEFPERAVLAGKGLWQSDSILLPLSGNKLVRYRIQDGALLDEATVNEPLGNLFAHRGNLISASPTTISIYFTRDRLRESVDQRLSENANDTEALNQKSQLAYATGDVDAAYELLRQSYAIDPDDVETRSLLVEILLAGLESDFDRYESAANELRMIVEDDPKRARFLQWLAMGSIRSGNSIDAFGNLLAFMRERVTRNSGVTSGRRTEMRMDALHKVDADVWIATELGRIYAAASERDQQEMEALVDIELDSISNSILSQQRLKLQYFTWHPRAAPFIMESAIKLAQSDETVASEQMLVPLLHSSSAEIREVAAQLLASKTIADTNLFDPRGVLFSSVYSGDGTLSLVDTVDDASEQDRSVPVQWNRGQILVEARNQGIYPNGSRLPMFSERYGKPDIEVKLSADEVVLANINGQTVQRLRYSRASSDSNSTFDRAIMRGGLLIIETSSEVVAFDIYRGLENPRDALLWRQSFFSNAIAGRRAPFGQPGANRTETCFGVQIQQREARDRITMVGPMTPAGLVMQLDTSLICIEPYTGRQIWTRDGYDQNVRIAHQGLELAVVNPGMGTIEMLDCRDGAELSRRRYEGDWKHWYAYGAMIVDYREEQSSNRGEAQSPIMGRSTLRPIFRVWNAFTGEELALLDQLETKSRAATCEGRYLVVADQSDKLHFMDLAASSYHVWDAAIDAGLENMAVERFGDQLVVLSNSAKSSQELTDLRQDVRPQDSHEIHGSVYAIDLTQVRLAWKTSGKLMGMYFPVNQPRNSPFMAAYRFNPRRRNESAVVALVDLRDGRLVFANDRLTMDAPGGFAMLLRPRAQIVEMMLGNRNYIFRLTDGPRPPQPVFSYGHLQKSKTDRGFDAFFN